VLNAFAFKGAHQAAHTSCKSNPPIIRFLLFLCKNFVALLVPPMVMRAVS